ncbi:Component of the SF3b subcomplex of the U2 snRNP [Lignoscripta atroalba]|nr:Component of the SF3b subcomplex of the U2 snRNP [Lignoscripta atroalba]
MPPIRSARNRKPPPDGFDDIEDTLLEFSNKMKDAENSSHEGKKRQEVLWPIFQISHQRSRYIYDLYYDKEAITKALYDYLLKNGYADGNLIAKWKKQGYVAYGVYRPRKRTLMRHAFAEYRKRS